MKKKGIVLIKKFVKIKVNKEDVEEILNCLKWLLNDPFANIPCNISASLTAHGTSLQSSLTHSKKDKK